MMLNIFEEIENLPEEKQHEKFKLLKSNWQFSSEKQMLLEWTNGFVDRDNKIVRQFQETFHSTLWEIYLYQLLKEIDAELDQTHDRPDFKVMSPIEFYIEAVTANIKDTGRKENERTLEDQFSMIVPPYMQIDFDAFLNEAIVRAANSIKKKHDKMKKYLSTSWVREDKPFIIALSSYDQVNYGREYIYSMMAVLYGLYFNAEKESYVEKEFVQKENSVRQEPLGLFFKEEFSDVSAIIFTCTLTLGKLTSLSISRGNPSLNVVYNIRKNCEKGNYMLQLVSPDLPEDFADGVFIFHNPNAKNKLSETVFNAVAVTQFFYDKKCLKYLGNETPIVARYNTSMAFQKVLEPEILENIRHYNRLKREDFYEISECEDNYSENS